MKKTFIATVAFILFNYFTYAQTWSSATLTEARGDCAVGVVNKKLIVAGGGTNYLSLTVGKSSRIDIYDDITGLWTTKTLSSPRFNPYSAIIGKKMYIIGGQEGDSNNPSNKYDVYDTETNSLSKDTLPFKPFNTCVAYLNNKILFAGGDVENNFTFSNKVKIWDVSTNIWTLDSLSTVRGNIRAMTLGNKIFFIGGLISDDNPSPNSLFSDVIDIYDTVTRTWSHATLSKARMYPMVSVIGKKMIILGGIERFGYVSGYINGFFSKKVDIYDSETNTWSSSEIPEPRGGNDGISWAGNAYFIWGSSSNSSNSFDYTKINVYNPTNNVWSNLSFPATITPRTAQTASINNKIFIIGGNSNLIPSNKIDILTLTPTSTTKDYNLSKMELSTYPNPTKDIFFVKFKSDFQSDTHISLSNFSGQLVKNKDVKIYIGENTIEMSCQDIPNGIYWLNIKSDKSMGTTLFVKN